MRQVASFTRPEKHGRHPNLSALSRAIKCSAPFLRRMAALGVIEQYRGAYDSEECCARIEEYNRQVKGMPSPKISGPIQARLDMNLIRAASPRRRNVTAPDPVEKHQAQKNKTRQQAPLMPPPDGAILEQYPDESLLGMVRDSIADGLPGEDPITRKHRLEGDKAALLIATRRGLLIERAAVLDQIAQVSEVVVQELSDFCREIDAGYMSLIDPEERIEWGQAQLRERLERVMARFGGVGGGGDASDAD